MWNSLRNFLLLLALAFACMTLIPVPIVWYTVENSISEIFRSNLISYRYLILGVALLSSFIVSMGGEKLIFWDKFTIGGGLVSAASVFIVVRTIIGSS